MTTSAKRSFIALSVCALVTVTGACNETTEVVDTTFGSEVVEAPRDDNALIEEALIDEAPVDEALVENEHLQSEPSEWIDDYIAFHRDRAQSFENEGAPLDDPIEESLEEIGSAENEPVLTSRSLARPATTRNVDRWLQRIADNYPARALREEIEGSVGVKVTVTPRGRASNCSVRVTSGSRILDEAACVGIERYGRFNPALDADGVATNGEYATSIRYKLNR